MQRLLGSRTRQLVLGLAIMFAALLAGWLSQSYCPGQRWVVDKLLSDSAFVWSRRTAIRCAGEVRMTVGPELWLGMARALNDVDSEVRLRAAKTLEQYRGLENFHMRRPPFMKAEHELVAAAVRLEEKETIRLAALQGLHLVGGDGAIRPLTALIQRQDESDEVVAATYWAFLRIAEYTHNPDALDGLIHIARSSRARSQEHAIRILGEFGNSAIPSTGTLVEVVRGGTPATRDRAADALGKIHQGAAESPESSVTIDVLSEMMSQRDLSPYFRKHPAATALASIGPQALPTVFSQLSNSDPFVRRTACTALFEMEEERERITPVLLDVLGDEDDVVRSMVIRWFIRWRRQGAAALPRLAQLLDNEETAIRLDAIRALSIIGRERQSAFALQTVARSLDDVNDTVRLLALTELGAWRCDAKAVETRVRALSLETHTEIRQAAREVLDVLASCSLN